ncbi:cytoskeletal protein [Lithospermum erythrorhizon]
MADPLTALMYAVQVMNFLKTLIERTLRERQDTAIEPPRISQLKPSDEDGHQKPSQLPNENVAELDEINGHVFVVEEHDSETVSDSYHLDNISDEEVISYSSSTEEYDGSESCETPNQEYIISTVRDGAMGCRNTSTRISKIPQSSDPNQAKSVGQQLIAQSVATEAKSKGISNLSRINSITERVEAWR